MSSDSIQKVLMKRRQRCEQQEQTSIRTSIEPHLNWKKYFHKNLLHFLDNSDFEADNGIDKYSIFGKTANV